MRTQPRLRRFIPSLAIATLLVCAGTDAFAQETRKAAPASGKEERAAATPSPPYDLEIKDGLMVWSATPRKDNAKQVPANLANVVDLLRELHPEANFAMSPKLADTDISYLKMRSSSAEEKLEAIRIASGASFLWRKANAPGLNPQTSLPASPDLYALDALPEEAKPSLQVEAFNVSTYIKSFNTYPLPGKPDNAKEEDPRERVEQIRRMALETVNDYEVVSMTLNNSKARSLRSPSIRFHPGANLIIIIGEPEAVAVAAKVIGALPGAQRSVAASVRESDGSSRETLAEELSKRARPDGSRPTPQR